MATTVSVSAKSHNKAIIKVVGTASADTATIAISTPITISSPGNSTFSASNKTITRATGSWITDGVVVGAVLVITSTLNSGTYIVKTINSATQLTIENNTSSAKNFFVDETAAATYTGSYKSDLLAYGQILSDTPIVNISRAQYSVSSAGDVTVVRNSKTIFKFFGHDEWQYPTSEENTYPIVVTFNTSAGGTIELELAKVSGFSAVNPSSVPY